MLKMGERNEYEGVSFVVIINDLNILVVYFFLFTLYVGGCGLVIVL